MDIDVEEVKRIVDIVDNFSYEKTGKRIINDMCGVWEKMGVKDIVINLIEGGNIIEWKFNGDELELLVPKELRERIAFSRDYIFSRFDKIEESISDISKEFDTDRFSEITNAVKELKNYQNECSEDSKQILMGCLKDVGRVLDGLKGKIKILVDEINNIPKERKRRLLKTPIKKRLRDVQLGRKEVEMLVLGTQIYAEMNLKINRKDAAKNRLKDTKKFFMDICDNGGFERVEQWNKDKDHYWESGIKKEIIKLESCINELERDNDKIIIK